jgi:hypothetical protein
MGTHEETVGAGCYPTHDLKKIGDLAGMAVPTMKRPNAPVVIEKRRPFGRFGQFRPGIQERSAWFLDAWAGSQPDFRSIAWGRILNEDDTRRYQCIGELNVLYLEGVNSQKRNLR